MSIALRFLLTLFTILCCTTISGATVQEAHEGVVFEKRCVIEEETCFSAIFNASRSVLTPGAARAAKFGHLWQKAPIDKAIARHAGDNYTSWVTNSGKRIFENPSTGRQIVQDLDGGYFRIFQPNKIGGTKGKYLDMLGKVPAPARRVKSGQIKNDPLTGGDLQQATHFLIE
jgi:hypothetical protein